LPATNPPGRRLYAEGEAVMLRKWLISLGLLSIVLTACDPQLLIAKSDPSDYEVVALIAQ
jgi:hypothetical protein